MAPWARQAAIVVVRVAGLLAALSFTFLTTWWWLATTLYSSLSHRTAAPAQAMVPAAMPLVDHALQLAHSAVSPSAGIDQPVLPVALPDGFSVATRSFEEATRRPTQPVVHGHGSQWLAEAFRNPAVQWGIAMVPLLLQLGRSCLAQRRTQLYY